MVKIQKISEIESTLGFTEFDFLEKYRSSFSCSELARSMGLKTSRLARKSYFSPEGKLH